MNAFLVKLEAFISKIIRSFFSLLHKDCDDSKITEIVQFIKFSIVGVSNTFISYVINILVLVCLSPMQLAWDYIVGNIISFLLSVLWSFYWNNKYVFTLKEGESRSIAKALLKTYISYGFTGIILNNILSWLWISILGISKYIAPIINLLASVPINYIINKLWAFRKE